MNTVKSKYDVAIVGGGHNGLVAACYLAKAGMSVLVLERNPTLGGATRSARVFDGLDASLSVYSYLVSLFPDTIAGDLGLNLELRSRRTASWTPSTADGHWRELLIRNGADDGNRGAFVRLTGDDRDFRGFTKLQKLQADVARIVWPSLTEPLATREKMRGRLEAEQREAWEALVEEPLGGVIERLIEDDLVRGLVFTDAKIGVSTFPHDPSLLQNRVFLYHVIGRGTGEWRVPVGGMGSVARELVRVASSTGRVTSLTDAGVSQLCPGEKTTGVEFVINGETSEVDVRYVLCNASAEVLGRLTGDETDEQGVEGSVFKINMLLENLPAVKAESCGSNDAFCGTFHIDEGYEQMQISYEASVGGTVPERPPGEVYCHTLTDDSILSRDLAQRGFHTLTLFGLDTPYRLFVDDNARVREQVLARYLAGLNRYLEEPIEECLARDADGNLCIEAKSPVDLEAEIHLPRGNIFHGDLSWPFCEDEQHAGSWGVETSHPNIHLCGSAAMRGGCVSGIPGHNAAMKVLEQESAGRA